MDFTVQQFLDMFHRYNEAIWPVQIVGYAIGLFIVAMLIAGLRGSPSFLPSPTLVDRLLPALLGGYWAWLGVVFMWGYQADISASGRPFGVLFLIGAAAFGVAAFAGTDLGLGRVPSWRLAIGGSMIVYALLFYPLLGALAGHTYPSAPIFGVAPCPTAIFTFGVLVCCTRPRWYLLAVPLVWACIATMAAVKLGIAEDFGLIVSAVVTALVVFWLASPRRARDHSILVSADRL
jgi:Family of unknown function (DUF6064)